MTKARTLTTLVLIAFANLAIAGTGGGTGSPVPNSEPGLIEWLLGLMGIVF